MSAPVRQPPQPPARQTTRVEGGTIVLCLGPHHILTGSSLAAADVIVLARLHERSPADPVNTIVLAWDDTTATTIEARTADDSRRASAAPHDLDPIYQALRPAPAVARLHQHLSNAPAEHLVPLFCLTEHPRGVHIYSRVRLHLDDACFLRTTADPVASTVTSLGWLPEAVALHAQHAQFLNSHAAAFQKAFPSREIEYKYTLDPTTEIWTPATDLHTHLQQSPPPGFVPEYRDTFQMWDYHNHVFETVAPPGERGYVSFIPTADDTYIVKQKRFTVDGFDRGEHHTHGVTIDTPFVDYLSGVLGLTSRPLPPFRRVRYDVNLESIASGHLYAALFDRVTLLARPDLALVQCELEYRRSRTVLSPDEPAVLVELDRLGDWLETFFVKRGLATDRGSYSKLSFLRDAVAAHPGLATQEQSFPPGCPDWRPAGGLTPRASDPPDTVLVRHKP
ncbi:hypothetical protein [Frankia sp. CiP3]|uniref:hypothetical protein n=1 Tax=Frankia sp. CiP3 TaxID=2880971 RepID=UPI001EF723D9|nr:hypothetical protein [Frankia sp. CiP3]